MVALTQLKWSLKVTGRSCGSALDGSPERSPRRAAEANRIFSEDGTGETEATNRPPNLTVLTQCESFLTPKLKS